MLSRSDQQPPMRLEAQASGAGSSALLLVVAFAGVLTSGACARDREVEAEKDDILVLPNADAGSNDGGSDTTSTDVGPDLDPFGCGAYCEHLFACLDQICAEDRTDAAAVQGCIDSCVGSEPFHEYAATMTTYSCPRLHEIACTDLGWVAQSCDCSGVVIPVTSVGDQCSTTTDCDGGRLSPQCMPATANGSPTGFEGGYCTAVGCQTNVDCGAGNLCVFKPQGSQCFAGCESDRSCRAGYSCWPAPPTPRGYCMPACGSALVCGNNLVCVRGACAPPPACATDAPCPANLQCTNGRCATIPCTSNAQCVAGLLCAEGICN